MSPFPTIGPVASLSKALIVVSFSRRSQIYSQLPEPQAKARISNQAEGLAGVASSDLLVAWTTAGVSLLSLLTLIVAFLFRRRGRSDMGEAHEMIDEQEESTAGRGPDNDFDVSGATDMLEKHFGFINQYPHPSGGIEESFL
jgi:hypothetical protein